ncbi:hypothetical protein [Marininema halotolerans]|uniref:hypothetical protein n=1 Tax=Marininema halotolerans TaxID=1155944 RepID=UPI001124FCE9|nr:hypothetical protein [Marininema halotolerans]
MQIKDSNEKKQSNDVISVKEFEVNDAPFKQSKTPEEAVIHQVKYKLSNKKVVQAKKKNVLYSVTYGNQGVTAVKVPSCTVTDYFLFSTDPDNDRKEKRYWAINGVLDVTIGEMEKDSKGLALPFKEFVSGKFSIDDNDKKVIWAIANEKHVITIGKFPIPPLDHKLNGKPQLQFPLENFSPKDPKRDSILNMGKHYLFLGTKGNPILYYREGDSLIWISGNVSEKELKKLAASLPKVSSSSFPFSKE